MSWKDQIAASKTVTICGDEWTIYLTNGEITFEAFQNAHRKMVSIRSSYPDMWEQMNRPVVAE